MCGVLGIIEGLAQLTQRTPHAVRTCMSQNSQRTTISHFIHHAFYRFLLVDNSSYTFMFSLSVSLSLSHTQSFCCFFCKPLQFLFKLSLIGFSSRDYTMFPLFSCAVWWINPGREVLIHITCSFSSHWLLIVHFAGASVSLFVCVISTLFILCDNTVTIQLWRLPARLL